jgi:hypothetical protein
VWRWLDERLGRMNATYDWRPARGMSLTYDFDAHRLNAVPLRGELRGLSFLGPADNKRQRDPAVLRYQKHGIGLIPSDEGERLEGVVFAFGDLELRTYAGAFRHGGQTFRLGRASSEDAVRAALGEPAYREPETEVDVVLYYAWPDEVEAQFAFERGELASLEVSIYPELPSLLEKQRGDR